MGKPLSEKKASQASLGEKLTPIEPATSIPNALIGLTQATRYIGLNSSNTQPKILDISGSCQSLTYIKISLYRSNAHLAGYF
jgi:hypothetical protein